MNTVLIVEDEPLLCGVYQNLFVTLENEGKLPKNKILTAHTAEAGLSLIEEARTSNHSIDFCMLDYRIGGQTTDGTPKNGLMLGLEAKIHFPDCKVMMITSITDRYVMYSILTELNPDGFLIKSDIDLNNLKRDVGAILDGQMVYSKKVREFVRKSRKIFKDIDDRDLKMIHLLDKGLSLPEIGTRLGLSISGIEYRKRRIAQNLGSSSSNIQELLDYVRKELKLI
ncbi:hypothetical protein ABV409_14945 [Flagellimonas sp. DF-77]|uniref:hypothetical protein n=1 Tax=Flagellimonas algarum TaxID=3230298 RepID=UPI003398EABF